MQGYIRLISVHLYPGSIHLVQNLHVCSQMHVLYIMLHIESLIELLFIHSLSFSLGFNIF